MGNVIEVEGLRKEYRRLRGRPTLALDGLDLAGPRRWSVRLPRSKRRREDDQHPMPARPGRSIRRGMRLLDARLPSDLSRVVSRVGSIVEAPALFPRFSGRRNLEILARLHGIGRRAIDDLLALVGLIDRAEDLVRTYSLGMRQRLGLGAALLKDPEVLILDEPANGLDPAGIVEVRELLRRLGTEGRTVFVSSHILSEVQQIADRVAILAGGRCVAAGPVDEVLATGAGAGLIVRVRDLDAGRAALVGAGIPASVVGGDRGPGPASRGRARLAHAR